jgi:hypothetical protein
MATFSKMAVLGGVLLIGGCADAQKADVAAQATLGHSARWIKQNALYCSSPKHAPTKIFAGLVEPDGSLTFGLSIWAGNNIALYGEAVPDGDGWRFTQAPDEYVPNLKCKVRIVMDATGAPTVIGDPEADCTGAGGNGMTIGTEKFQKRDYEGPVTFQLDDLEAFWTRAGKCAGGHSA